MPLSHTRTIRVRHYECDAYGHVNNANYLRYIQETALDASAAVGYTMAKYAEIERTWLVRETDIEYLRPLRYNDVVEIKTWVADFRRVRSHRAYEFRDTKTGEIVAKAQTDWVFLDTSTGRPTQIPQEVIDNFFPGGQFENTARERFPEPPPPPPGVFTMQRKVEWRDIDPIRHVNNATYLTYMDEAGIQICYAYGWPLERMLEEGFAIVARQHRIEYLQQAQYGDEVEIATWVSGARHTSATRHYVIRRAESGEILARAHSLYVWVDIETGKPIRIPEHFWKDFTPNIVEKAI